MIFYSLKILESKSQDGPSIQEFAPGYDINSKNSATKIDRYQEIRFEPDLRFSLADDGVATDIISVSFIYSNHLIVTDRAFGIFRQYNLSDYQRFNAFIESKNNVFEYKFLHFYHRFDCDESGMVDFSRTRFLSEKTPFPLSLMATPTREDGMLGEFSVSSWKEFHSIRDKKENDHLHRVILPKEKLYMKESGFKNLDLFYMRFRNFQIDGFVVSERLANELMQSGVSGIKLEKLPFDIEVVK